jgi:hypothetical protein
MLLVRRGVAGGRPRVDEKPGDAPCDVYLKTKASSSELAYPIVIKLLGLKVFVS